MFLVQPFIYILIMFIASAVNDFLTFGKQDGRNARKKKKHGFIDTENLTVIRLESDTFSYEYFFNRFISAQFRMLILVQIFH